jgi:uncharacterized protein YkwD
MRNFLSISFSFLFGCVFFCVSYGYAQKTDSSRYPFPLWEPVVLKAASTANEVDSLTSQEKEVVKLMNLARMNGKLFRQTYAQMYFDQQDTVDYKDRYISTLIDQLEKLPKLPPLMWDKDLFKSARSHAIDMGISGKTGHTNYSKRMAVADKKFATTGENCDYGNNDALEIVMDLLIDEDVYDFGHRKNILDKEYSYVGVSIKPHKEFEYNCVMDFGGGKAYAHNQQPVKKSFFCKTFRLGCGKKK